MPKSNFQIEESIKEIIEDTFDTCNSNIDEIRWLICILRSFLKIPNRNNQTNIENYKLNLWQYNLYPITKKFFDKYKL